MRDRRTKQAGLRLKAGPPPGEGLGRGWGWRLLPVASLGMVLAALSGCIDGDEPGAGPVEQQEPIEVVVRRVNQNNGAMDFVLRGVGSASGRYLKSNGKTEPFSQSAKLLYRRPRDLYLKLEHTLGEDVMEIGSNQGEFWVWKRIDNDVYWWGRHDQMDPQAEADLPIRPDHLVEVIGLGDLPVQADPVRGPLFEVLPERYQFTFLDNRGGGALRAAKRVRVDRRPPFLVREVDYLRPNGRPSMTAKLSRYRTVDGTSVLVPHHVVLDWPDRRERLELEFNRMDRFEDVRKAAAQFRSPREQGRDVGEQIRVDTPHMSQAAARQGRPATQARVP